MTGDIITPFPSFEASENEALSIAERVSPDDRLLTARLGLAWVSKVGAAPKHRRAMLALSKRLIELELASLVGKRPADVTTLLLHEADDYPALSRVNRAGAVLQMVLKRTGTEAQPQAPGLALEYVHRLIELEMAGLDEGPDT